MPINLQQIGAVGTEIPATEPRPRKFLGNWKGSAGGRIREVEGDYGPQEFLETGQASAAFELAEGLREPSSEGEIIELLEWMLVFVPKFFCRI